jgi:hypothetical protein
MNGDNRQRPYCDTPAFDDAAKTSSEGANKSPGEDLTRIRETYTLSPTQEGGEVDDLMIKQFLNTLAEVAMAAAARKINHQDSPEGMPR